MSANTNGVITLKLGEQRKTSTVLGVMPSSNLKTQITQDIVIHTEGLFLLGDIDDLEIFSAVIFYKPVKDINPTSPTFGAELSRPLMAAQPTVTITGVPNVVSYDPYGIPPGPVNPPRLFFEAEEPFNLFFNPHPSIYNRRKTAVGSTFTVTVALDWQVALPVGSYQGEILLFCSDGLIGTLLLTLEVQDIDQLFQGDPSVVWYHLV